MGWFYSQNKEAQEDSEAVKEQKLLEELPPSLSNFYKTETKLNEFKFNEDDSDNPNLFKEHVQGLKEKAFAATNCAEFESKFVNCVTNGSFKDKISGCDVENKAVEKCLKFQLLLFKELGLMKTGNINRFDNINDTADELGVKWFDEFDDKKGALDGVILNDVYEKREKIWK